MSWTDISILVLASGLSKRFGAGDKLLRKLHGRRLAEHIAQTVRILAPVHAVVVVGNKQVAELFAGFDIVFNPEPELGLGHSLQLAAQASSNPSVLVCLADMPFVTAEILEQLRERHRAGSSIVATKSGLYQGPPCIFERDSLLRLDLERDVGARELRQKAEWITVDQEHVRDFDFQHQFPRNEDSVHSARAAK